MYTMKKNILLIGLLGLGIVSCKDKPEESDLVTQDKKEEVVSNKAAPEITLVKETKPVLFDYTSTGCPGCGSWGAPTFENIAENQKRNIVPIAVHIKYGDPMITNESNDLADNRIGQRFTPQLFVNGSNGVVLTGGRIDGAGSLTKIDSELSTIRNSNTEISVGISSVVNEKVISLRYALKAYEDLEGEYSISVYVMEDHLFYKQSSGAANPFEHNYVIRASQGGAFGMVLDSETLTKNSETEETFDIAIADNWNRDNLHATVVVWKKVGNNYEVVNANNNKVY